MNVLWITVALLVAGFAGWPVTALVFRLARTIDDRADAAKAAEEAKRAAEDPSADVTVDLPPAGGSQGVDGELTAAADTPPSGLAGSGAAAPAQRILRGGAIIGILERLGVCLAILTGQPVAIAYIVAIKGLGRFAELKETPVAAERFIIGTLASMLWAAGTAAAIKVLFLA
ncbi:MULTISPECIES: hypothetical protein [Pseudarthrobacter]|uniref:MAPEG family protein n=1 Tax=Pseudarthrobacter polychromogenes TaxID=1676 RepID=A0ABQ1XBX9_9MICC|nr:hypothetical protein [Pseudarthrobacter polychromogenes]MBD1539703.1 hypothetical protein [Arthrobacter sp. S13_S34]MBD1593546.1 hypothetical protein [Arthrobacter sp. S1_S22]GGG89645.1 hypothetical protein GCM10011577_09990 [Pseudarthrobacter polychromogenes]